MYVLNSWQVRATLIRTWEISRVAWQIFLMLLTLYLVRNCCPNYQGMFVSYPPYVITCFKNSSVKVTDHRVLCTMMHLSYFISYISIQTREFKVYECTVWFCAWICMVAPVIMAPQSTPAAFHVHNHEHQQKSIIIYGSRYGWHTFGERDVIKRPRASPSHGGSKSGRAVGGFLLV